MACSDIYPQHQGSPHRRASGAYAKKKTYRNSGSKYCARGTYKHKVYHLGTFDDEVEAALTYDAWLEAYTPTTYCEAHQNSLTTGEERCSAKRTSTQSSPEDCSSKALSDEQRRAPGATSPSLYLSPTPHTHCPRMPPLERTSPNVSTQHGTHPLGNASEQRALSPPLAECEQNKSLPADTVLGKHARTGVYDDQRRRRAIDNQRPQVISGGDGEHDTRTAPQQEQGQSIQAADGLRY